MATDVVDVVVEEVADNLEELAVATRRINTRSVGFFLGGVAVGAAVGFYFGRKWNKEKLKAEAFLESEEEIAKIREAYQQKSVAAQVKPSAETIVEEKGYSVSVPARERPLPAPVPVREAVKPPPVVTYEGGKDRNLDWSFADEVGERTDAEPYVIHQDEYTANEKDYSHMTYTYYAEDGVMVDEDGHPVPHGDLVVGIQNLKFGHGSDDIDVVFVRNDRLQREMEICRLAESYEESVLGLERNDDDSEN